MNSSREYLLAAENILFWYSLPLKNEWGMTTATRTLDLFCEALGPGAGLEKGERSSEVLKTTTNIGGIFLLPILLKFGRHM